jgi:flagella basal body P-ring formation protein FlgA
VIDLEAQAGSIKVSTSGTALTDGRLGQKIRIKNNQSDRIVTGTVVASGKVSTL